jgi:hypothetical protein
MPTKKTRRNSKPAWTEKTPNKEGWYWYREKNRDVVLHVFDPMHNGHWKAWDWDHGRLMLREIAEYDGLWYGPIEAPK